VQTEPIGGEIFLADEHVAAKRQLADEHVGSPTAPPTAGGDFGSGNSDLGQQSVRARVGESDGHTVPH
jgi:hypothetical protein